MPALNSFDFAAIRVVPRVERGEFVNAGVIVLCLERKFPGSLVQVDGTRLKTLWPDLDLAMVRDHLEAFPRSCTGDPDSGPIGRLAAVNKLFQGLVTK